MKNVILSIALSTFIAAPAFAAEEPAPAPAPEASAPAAAPEAAKPADAAPAEQKKEKKNRVSEPSSINHCLIFQRLFSVKKTY
ncbi:MAG: hypothetical protein ACKOAD_08825, partial [Gammaproteobacteria bacterium]